MSIELLQDLIAIPSYSGQERPVQEFIKFHFEQSRLEPFFQGENLIVHLKGKDSTRAFIFNSHTDVVDAGDESRWKHGPWGGDIEEGRIYGRGTSDMKGGVYASMETAKALARKDELPCDLWFTYVVREETDGFGTKSFAKWFIESGFISQYKEIAAIFTEPTNLNIAEYGHKGNFFIRASIDGEAGHSSRPDQIKTHAIMQMVRFINDLEEEGKQWQEQFQNSEFTSPTITPTAIEAKSTSPNKTSDHCEAVFDLRTIPDFHTQAFQRVQELAQKRGISVALLYPEAPVGYTNPSSKIIKALQNTNSELTLKVLEASADLGFLTHLGVEGVIFGPGEMKNAHIIDEFAEVSQIEKAPQIFEKIYYEWTQL